MSSILSALFGRDEPPRPGPAAPPAASTAGPAGPAELEQTLHALVDRADAAGGRMPEGAVPAVHEVVDTLLPLLRYLRDNPTTEAEMVGVRAIVTDYLPTTLDTYLKLPAEFVTTHRNRAGRTAADELLAQLAHLADGAEESATAIYAGDAQRLTNQGRFLESRFARSELDL